MPAAPVYSNAERAGHIAIVRPIDIQFVFAQAERIVDDANVSFSLRKWEQVRPLL